MAQASAARSARSADEPQSKRQHLEAQLEASVRRRTDELGMSNNYVSARQGAEGEGWTSPAFRACIWQRLWLGFRVR